MATSSPSTGMACESSMTASRRSSAPACAQKRRARFTASEEIAPDDLITAAQTGYGDLTLQIEPLAFGPLRLEAPDGRISLFPRAMCRVRADDGRTGVAWVEWNRNVSA